MIGRATSLDELMTGEPVSGPALAMVMRKIARTEGDAVSRRDLVDTRLGLSPGTVSKAVSHLVRRGVLTEAPHASSGQGPGRPTVPLRWNDSYVVLGVAIEGRGGRPAGLTGVVTTLDGQPIPKAEAIRRSLPHTRSRSEDSLVQAVADFVADLGHPDHIGDRKALGVGVNVGGHVDNGVVRQSVNTGWGVVDPRQSDRVEGFHLEERLQAATGLTTVLENDVTALAVAESLHAHRPSNFAQVAVFYEALGGGLVMDGAAWRGHRGMAGEIGHISVDHGPHARRCRCTHNGCVEAYATPQAILRETGGRSLHRLARMPNKPESVATTFEEAGRALGRGVTGLINWVNPGLIIFYLPREIHEAKPDTAGAQYYRGLEDELSRGSFPDGSQTHCEYVGDTRETFELREARAASSLVLNHSIENLEARSRAGPPTARAA